MRHATVACFILAGVLRATSADAGFMDLSTLTTGSSGTFSGTLDGVSVSGALTSTAGFVALNAVGTTFGDSTTNNTSPQYSYGSIYSPSQALTDRVGYLLQGGTIGAAQIVITFGQAVTNPVFQVGNLDSMVYDFSPTGGLGALTLLSGNGGGGDGLAVSGLTIVDLNPGTLVGTSPASSPPTSGGRSAYGSVLLNGTFSSLTINLTHSSGAPSQNGDAGSFTLSNVPEPSSMILLTSGLLLLAGAWIRKSRRHASHR